MPSGTFPVVSTASAPPFCAITTRLPLNSSQYMVLVWTGVGAIEASGGRSGFGLPETCQVGSCYLVVWVEIGMGSEA